MNKEMLIERASESLDILEKEPYFLDDIGEVKIRILRSTIESWKSRGLEVEDKATFCMHHNPEWPPIELYALSELCTEGFVFKVSLGPCECEQELIWDINVERAIDLARFIQREGTIPRSLLRILPFGESSV